jgi:hypothetical protein
VVAWSRETVPNCRFVVSPSQSPRRSHQRRGLFISGQSSQAAPRCMIENVPAVQRPQCFRASRDRSRPARCAGVPRTLPFEDRLSAQRPDPLDLTSRGLARSRAFHLGMNCVLQVRHFGSFLCRHAASFGFRWPTAPPPEFP